MWLNSPVVNYYRKYLNCYRTQVVIPSVLACGVFLVPTLLKFDYLSLISGIIIGLPLIFLTTGHGYLVKRLSNEEAEKHKNEITEYKNEIAENEKQLKTAKEITESAEAENRKACHNYDILRHLHEVTNRLVNEKRAYLSKSDLSPQQRFDKCVTLNLMALNFFYEIHSRGVDFRIIFFVPQGSFLKPYLWYNHKHITPKSMGDPSRFAIVYDFNSRERKVCECWRTKQITIVEDAQAEGIQVQHPGQEIYFKSMIAYPVINPDTNSITGIISIVADQPNFFKRNDMDYHRFIFEHFATRINFENSEYLKTSHWRSV